jgi:septum formation protein
MHIILGSQSPRRKEILEFFKLPFTVVSSHFDESLIPFEGSPTIYTQTLAKEKALSIRHSLSSSIHQPIVTADTTVYFNKQNFSKPSNDEEAFLFLKQLSGNTHEVYTSMALLHEQALYVDTALTYVTFHSLSDSQIERYIETASPFDKAGGYAIQGLGSLLVSRIEGCYYNVMGLPVEIFRILLKKVDIDLWDYI